tara:strand:- start:10512 stop:11093 length:582 start_codon:yes stop_codon:yes gene_type:complete
MIPKGLFTQIAMIILSVGILITYVQPTFAEIGKVQDQIEVYQQERKKVIDVNSRLASFVSDLENVSRDDNRRLLTYLPDEVDAISVPRDLALIVLSSGALYQNVSYAGKAQTSRGSSKANTDEVMPTSHAFTLNVEGAYPQIKTLFRLLEQNEYPLEVHGVSVQQNDGGFLSVSIQIVTYEFNSEVTDKEIIF